MKNGLILYHEYLEHFALLSDSELGQLIRAVIRYDKDGTVPALSGMVKMAFSFIKTNLDIDRAKYEARCEKNRRNGMLGGRKRSSEAEKSDGEGEEPIAFPGFSEKAKKAHTDTETDIDTETKNGIDTETETDITGSNRHQKKLCELIRFYEQNVGQAGSVIVKGLGKWLEQADASLVQYAMEQAVVHDKRTWAYVNGIIECHHKAGRRTGEEAEKASRSRGGRKEPKKKPRYDFEAFERQALEAVMRGGK